MATIEQVVRIATNRSGAVDDVGDRLAAGTLNTAAGTRAIISNDHIPTTIAREGTGATAIVREGSGDARPLRLSNITVNGGTANSLVSIDATTGGITFSQPNQVSLGDVVTYPGTANSPGTALAARNADVTTVWHAGDLAIVNGTGVGGVADPDNGTYIYVGEDRTAGSTFTPTTNDSWIILATPTEGVTSISGDLAGFVSNATGAVTLNPAGFTLTETDGTVLAETLLTSVAFNDQTNALTINGNTIQIGSQGALEVARRKFISGALTALNINAAGDAVQIDFSDANFTPNPSSNPGGAPVLTGNTAAVYVDGIRVFEPTFGTNPASIVISDSAAQINNLQTLIAEGEQIRILVEVLDIIESGT